MYIGNKNLNGCYENREESSYKLIKGTKISERLSKWRGGRDSNSRPPA